MVESLQVLDPLDVIWQNIQIQYLCHSAGAEVDVRQKAKKDKTIEKIEEKSGNVIGERWEVQGRLGINRQPFYRRSPGRCRR